MKLDKKDRDLLTLLYADSRASFTEMGKRLQLSSSTVERRMRRLQESGVITLLFANINFAKFGLRSYRLYFKFDVMDAKTEKGMLTLFDSIPNTVWGVVCEGEYDIIWRIIVRDEMDVQDTIDLVTERFGTRIIEKAVATTTYQTYLSWNRAFGGVRKLEFPLQRASGIEKLSDTDMKILAALYGNARATTVELAALVGLTPDAVQYRIKKLTEKGFVLGYTAWYDAKKLGLEYYKILFGFRGMTAEKEKKFLDFCLEHDGVVFLNKTIGSWDIELDVIVKDVMELHGFLLEIKTKFGHMIGKHAYIAAIEERMLNPLRAELKKSPRG